MDLKGTAWHRMAGYASEIRHTANDLLQRKENVYKSVFEDTHSAYQPMKEHGVDGLFDWLYSVGICGHASKPGLCVNGSYLDCNPTEACAKYCYACFGHYIMRKVAIKGELIALAAHLDPYRVAHMISCEYNVAPTHRHGEALRMFDKGDINDDWLKVIELLNERGIRTQIFSKHPELIQMLDRDMNVIMWSVDASAKNLHIYPTLPLAFVYKNEDYPILDNLKDRFLEYGGVVLPIKGSKEIPVVPAWTEKYMCPIDSGKKTIQKGVIKRAGEWRCPDCDLHGSAGCFYGRSLCKVKSTSA